MAIQLRLTRYVENFQAALSSLLVGIPVYNSYDPSYAAQNRFVVWSMRNIRQDVYTGAQQNKGIDHPVFQVNVFAKTLIDTSIVADAILQAWHGYSGNLSGISVGKADVDVLFHTYDEEASLHQMVLDISMQVAVPTVVSAQQSLRG